MKHLRRVLKSPVDTVSFGSKSIVSKFKNVSVVVADAVVAVNGAVAVAAVIVFV